MSEQQFDELLHAFVSSIVHTLEEASLTGYASTVLLIDKQGDMAFNLLITDQDVTTAPPSNVAFHFGKAVAQKGTSVDAVFVAEETCAISSQPWILISGATIDGKHRVAILPVTRFPDGTIRGLPTENVDNPQIDIESHTAMRIVMGYQGR